MCLFFPQLVAGPIIRAKDFLPQLVRRTILTFKRLNLGMFLIICGLFKKIVIADSIAPLVNDIFAKPQFFSSVDHTLAVLGFTIQIYCDFSGYSDIAIGLALLMGFRIKKTLITHIYLQVFVNFGKDGIFHFPHGSEIMSISLLGEIEKEI